MNQPLQWFLIIILVLATQVPAQAHESQPGTLELRQVAGQHYELLWRAPIYFGRPHPARLELPQAWQTEKSFAVRQLSDSHLFSYMVNVGGEGIEGRVIRFPGLENTITDVFVRLTRLDGTTMTVAVRPSKPYVRLRGERAWHTVAAEYVALGCHHILQGIDHLLFILGLLLIVRGRMMLFKTVTAFTAAHSITLATATLGYARAPLPPLNAAIALSILFLGPEIVRAWRGESSLTIRYPWVVAFAFGLLHGFGFASGLSTTGMPQAELLPALLCFNVGVELGQLGFVTLVLAVEQSLKRIEFKWPKWAEVLPGYLVGSLGTYWTIQRVAILLGY